MGEINPSIGIIITARVKSSRIHEKVLQTIGQKRTIEILLDRLLRQDKYEVILAIPKNKDDDILEEIGISKGVMVYRGYDDSPLHRLYHCAKEYAFEYIVRITADDILIDTLLLFNQIAKHLNYKHDYSFIKKCPEGIAGEIIKVSILEKVAKELEGKSIEFVSYYLKRKNFKVFEYYPPREYQFSFRLTMDYPQDLMLLRLLFACLPEPIGTLDIINFLKQHKYFLQVNHVPAVTVYTCNYNTGEYILDCMKSVHDQFFSDYEYIVIDDNSTDNSVNIIMEYYSRLSIEKQKKMRVIRNDKNIGLSASSNLALSISGSNFLVRVDSDDVISKKFLSECLERIQIDGSQGCLTGYDKTDVALNIIETIKENHWHPGCALLSRWACNEIKYRDDVQFAEGDEFYKTWKINYKTSFIPEALWSYRQRPGQKTSNPEHPHNRREK